MRTKKRCFKWMYIYIYIHEVVLLSSFAAMSEVWQLMDFKEGQSAVAAETRPTPCVVTGGEKEVRANDGEQRLFLC